MIFYNPNLKILSKYLRRQMTEAEICLWSILKNKQLNGYRFHRQKIIGNYIVDFYCPAAKLVIEVDGGQHYSERMVESDKKREEFLKNHGLRIRRVNNLDVMENIEGVVQTIMKDLEIPL